MKRWLLLLALLAAVSAAAQATNQTRASRLARAGIFVGTPLTEAQKKISAAHEAAEANPAALHWNTLTAAERAQVFPTIKKTGEIQNAEQLAAALRGGAKFPCTFGAPITCPDCDGKRVAKSEGTAAVRKAAGFCAACKGTGKVSLPLAHILMW